MTSVPGNEIFETKYKFLNGDYPLRVINIVIKQFHQKSIKMNNFIRPSSLLDISKNSSSANIIFRLS